VHEALSGNDVRCRMREEADTRISLTDGWRRLLARQFLALVGLFCLKIGLFCFRIGRF